MADDARGIGDNKAPPDLKVGEALREELRDNHRDLLARRDELLQMADDFQADHPSVEDDATSGVLAGVISQLRKSAKEARTVHQGVKAPFLEGGRIVDNFFVGHISTKLDDVADELNKSQTAYLNAKADRRRREAAEAAARARAEEEARRREAERAERARRAAERAAAKAPSLPLMPEAPGPSPSEAADDARQRGEAARRAQELARVERQAQEATAAAPAADLSRTRGDFALASLRTVWDYELLDITQVPPEFLQVNAQLIRAAIRGKDGRHHIPGLRVFQVQTAQNR